MPGLQLINVAFGGALYQDIETQHPGALQHRNAVTYDQHFHDIQIVPDSRLAQLLPQPSPAPASTASTTRASSAWRPTSWSKPERARRRARSHPPQTRTGPRLHRRHAVAPEFHKLGSDTLDDTAILNDFLAACAHAKEHPVRPGKPGGCGTGRRGCCGEHCDVTGRRLGSENLFKDGHGIRKGLSASI